MRVAAHMTSLKQKFLIKTMKTENILTVLAAMIKKIPIFVVKCRKSMSAKT